MSEEIININCGIYCWTNKVNGKKYIGQAVNLKARKRKFCNWNNLIYAGDYINQARIKYNSNEYWDYEILEYCDEQQLNDREIYYISFYKTNIKEFGYNLTEGGSLGYTFTEDVKQKLSERMKGKNNPMFGKCLSEEHKKKISKGNKGKSISEETKRKMSEFHKGLTMSKDIKLKISNTLKGRYTGENHPFFGKHHSEDTRKKISEKNSISVLQYDMNMNLIKEWESIVSIYKNLGFNKKSITRHCKIEIADGYKGYKGYIWRYKI